MSRIYDSSAITQRRRDQAQAGSFINRIQNPNNPQTSYGPLQGNYDASIMNSVKMGQPKEFYRNSGCIIISNGCPCPPITVDEIISGSGPTPPVILAPGSVSNITVEYGSVIVRWDAPTEGGAPTSYTVSAIPSRGSTIIVTDVPTTSYSFATGALIDGIVYEMSVIGVNAAGNGSPPSSTSSPISGPYSAASDVTTDITTPNAISIGFSAYTFYTPSPLPPTHYTLKKYVNGTYASTTTDTYTTNLITVNSELNGTDFYSFQFQLSRPADNKYTSYTSLTTPTRINPAGPTSINYSNYSTTSVKINYQDFSTTGYDLTGATCDIKKGSASLSIQAGSLTNISVIVTGLSPATSYDGYTISFSKSPYNPSAASNLTTFYTYGEALTSVSYSSDGTNPTTTHIQCNYGNYTITGGFSLNAPASIVATYGSTTLNYNNLTNTTFTFVNLTAATIYNVQLTLYNSPYRSVTFPLQFITSSEAPTSFYYVNLGDTPVTFTFSPYTPFTSGVTTITFHATKNSTESVTIPGTVVNNQSMTISSLDLQATYTDAYIIIYNEQITSLPSNMISFKTAFPNPDITVISPNTCRTQQLEFSYGYFTPTGVSIVAPSGVTVSTLSGSNPYYVTLENLTPNTNYVDIKIQIIGDSGNISQYKKITFTTPPITVEGNIVDLKVGSDVGDVTTDHIIMRFNPFTSFGATGVSATKAIVTTSNGGVITTYSAIFDTVNHNNIKITGLTPGQELINPTIILTDDTNCFQSTPDTYGSTIRTYYNAPTGVHINNITNNSAQIIFTQYPYFDPYASGFSYTTVIATVGGNTGQEVTISQANSTSVSLSNLSVGVLYTDVVLKLISNTGLAAEPVSVPDFTPQWPAPTNVASAPDGFNNNQAIITYHEYSGTFGASNATLSGISGFTTNITNTGFTIYNLSAGTIYSQNGSGSFFLGNADSPPLYTGSTSIPEFITNGGPSTPDNIQVGTVTRDTASITFNSYGFTPDQIICETYTGGEFIPVTVVSSSEATLTGLGYPRGYNVKIRVIHNAQTSQWSSPFSFNT